MPEQQSQPVGGDVVGGDKIVVGDIQGSVTAIGAGAQVIYSHVERALTAVEVAVQQEQQEQRRLAEGVKAYIGQLQAEAEQAQRTGMGGTPYKALLHYDFEDAALFYGRTEVISTILNLLGRGPLTVLHAESGAGKTSLLKAGIMPRLMAGGEVPIYVRPYQQIAHLAVKRVLVPQLEQSPYLAVASLQDFLRYTTNLLGGQRVIIILDQLEELFTVQNEHMREDFLSELAPCLDDDLLPVRWIFSMRSEWFGLLGTFRPHVRNPYSNEFLLRRLNTDEAREIIVEPPRRFGVGYEEGLVDRVIADLSSQEGEINPPQLQLVCSTLYDGLPQDARTITNAEYDDLDGTSGILRSHLDRVLTRQFLPDQRQVARQILEALISSDRHRIVRPRNELAAELGALGIDNMTLDEVLRSLLESRLLSETEIQTDSSDGSLALAETPSDSSGEPANNEVGFELAHDYLVDKIELDPAVQSRKAAKELLSQKLPFYMRDKLLLSRDELQIIEPQESGLVLSNDETRLLRESKTRAHRQRRITLTGVVAAVVIIVGLSVAFAVTEYYAAQKALSRELAAQVNLSIQNGDVIQAYRSAYKAYQTYQSVESWGAMYSVLSHTLPVRVFLGHEDRVRSASFSFDGSRLVTASRDNTARVWDTSNGAQLLDLTGHQGPVNSAVFSPDGTQVLTASQDSTARLWDAETGHLIDILRGHTGEVWTAFYNSAGTQIVTAGSDKTIRIWDVATGNLVRTIAGRDEGPLEDPGHLDWVRWANFSPDGTMVVSASRDLTARVWDVATGEQLQVLIGARGWVNSANFSPDGQHVVTASGDGALRVYDVATGEMLYEVDSLSGTLFTAFYSPDGSQIVTSGGDGTARLWDATSGAQLLVLHGHTDQVLSAQFSGDGKFIATASDDRRTLLWQLDRSAPLPILSAQDQPVNSAVFSPDGTEVLTASNDRTAELWDAQTGQALTVLSAHTDYVKMAAFSPDGSIVVTASSDRTADVWDTQTGSLITSLTGHNEEIWWAAFSPDGTQVLTASRDGTARLWDPHTGAQLAVLSGHTEGLNMAAFSPDGTRIVTASDDMTARLWDAATGQNIAVLAGHTGPVRWAAFSPDGMLIVTTSVDRTARVWDAATGTLITTLSGHTDAVSMAAFSPDSARVVTASADRSARVWDAHTGQQVFELSDGPDSVNWAAFSPDGTLIVTGSGDGAARLWRSSSGTLIARLAGHSNSILMATFSPDGEQIVTASNDGTARVWRTDLGELPQLVLEQLAPLGYSQ